MKDEARNLTDDSGSIQTLLSEQTPLGEPNLHTDKSLLAEDELLSEQVRLAEGEVGTGEGPVDGTTAVPSDHGSPSAGSTPSANSTGASPGKGASASSASRRAPASTGGRKASPGGRKAAVFILSLDEEDASQILRGLSDDEVQVIVNEIAHLGVVEKETVASVMQEFRELEQLHSLVREGGMNKAKQLMERSLSPERAQRVLHILAAQSQNMPFVFLESVETETLMAFLDDEHPQTLAVILAHLSPGKAAEVLERISPESRRDVLERIASLEGVNAEALERIEQSLQKYLEAVRYESLGEAGGIKAVAEILRATAGGGSAFLDDIRQDQPELADEIDKHLFVFEDLVRLDDRAIQVVLKEFDSRYLALALKKTSETVKLKILNNLSRRAAESLRDEMDMLGPVRFVDVQSAQQAILQTILKLEQSGQLFISGRGCEENRIFY